MCTKSAGIFRKIIFFSIIALLTGCGGGGGGESPAPGPGGELTYVLSGTITVSSGGVLAGVTLTLSGTSSGTATTDASGKYTFTGRTNGAYTITPTLVGYTFTDASKAVTINSSDVTGADFIATANIIPTYSISGTITKSSSGTLSGVTMTLSGTSSGIATTDANGNYNFTGRANGSYTVTPSLAGYAFTPINRAVTVNGANKTGINFIATANPDPITALLNSLVPIPAGTFMMGSTDNEHGWAQYTTPVHQVTLQAFYIGAFEVTQAQYQAVMGVNPSYYQGTSYPGSENNPVETVSWYDARAFCTALSAMTGRTFTLPSEAQWEYACRAGTTTLYSFGDDDELLINYAWYRPPENPEWPWTHPVGTKLPNPWGLYDMHGNVEEWCLDFSHGHYRGAPTDGSAWGPEPGSYQITRGGWGACSAIFCRSAFRGDYDPDDGRYSIGFRVVINNITNSVPIADAGEDIAICFPDMAQLDGSGSGGTRCSLVTYAWTIISAPLGSIASLSDGNAINPTLYPDLEGTYVISLTVTDDCGNSASDTVTIICSHNLIAKVSPEQTTGEGDVVTLDASKSSDPCDGIASYAWVQKAGT